MKLSFRSWLYVSAEIATQCTSEGILCPNCNKAVIDFQYVGNPETKVGYLDVWCKNCLKGIHISRVLIPGNIPFLPFDAPKEVFLNRIPKFIEVLPVVIVGIILELCT